MRYTVKKVNASREFEGRFGKNIIYTLTLKNEEGVEDTADLWQKPETQPPDEGTELEGDIEETPFGKRIKKTRSQDPRAGERLEIQKERVLWEKRRQLLITKIALVNSIINYHTLIGDKPSLDQVFEEAEGGLKRIVGRKEDWEKE